jgi:hypothetical protein
VLLLATMFTLILATLLAVTIDVAAVAWHQRQLAALTDAAALAGAQGLDEAILYSRGATEVIPLDPSRVSELAHNYLAAANAPARFATTSRGIHWPSDPLFFSPRHHPHLLISP